MQAGAGRIVLLSLLAASLLALLGAASLLARRAQPAALEPAADAAPDEAPPVPLLDALEPDREPAARSASVEAAALPAVDVGARARAAAAGLAAQLRGPGYDRASWEVAARARAGALGPGSIDALCALAGDGEGSAEERVCAAELARLAADLPGAGPAPLLPVALSLLRQAVSATEDDARLATAASRALARLGQDGDRRRMVEALSSPASERGRDLAAYALQAARGNAVALDLCEAALAEDAGRGAGLATVVLESLGRDPLSGIDAGTRIAGAEALRGSLRGMDFGADAARRTLLAIAALDPASAVEPALAALDQDAGGEGFARAAAAALGRSEDPAVAARLREVLLDAQGGESRRLLAAEAVARGPREGTLRASASADACVALADILSRSESPGARRRAAAALASFDAPASRAALEKAAREDADPLVRAAAEAALRRR